MSALDAHAAAWAEPEAPAPGFDYAPERYGFVETILRKQGRLSDPGQIAEAKRRYAEIRRRAWRANFEPGELGEGVGAAFVTARPQRGSGFGMQDTDVLRLEVVHLDRDGFVRMREGYLDAGGTGRGDPLDEIFEPVEEVGARRSGAADAADGIDAAAGRERARRLLDPEQEAPSFWSVGRFQLNAFAGGHQKEIAGWSAQVANEIFAGLSFPDTGRAASAKRAAGRVIARFESRRLAGVLARFHRALDPEALYLCRRSGFTQSDVYNWLQGEDGSGEARTYRRQAALNYPLFLNDLRRDSRGRASVDAGDPPPRVIAEAVGFDGARSETERRRVEKAAARLHGLTWQRAGAWARRDPSMLLRWVARTPGNWLPARRADFQAFERVWSNAEGATHALGRAPSDLVAETGGRWGGWADRFDANPGDGLRDVAVGFARAVVYPAMHRALVKRGCDMESLQEAQERRMLGMHDEAFQKRIRQALFGDRGLKHVMEASKRWHQELPRLDEALKDPEVAADVSWTPLAARFEAPNGCIVEPLSDDAGLSAEGSAMRHCVGGYTRACLEHSHIVSIRDAKGKRLSTAQLRDQREKPEQVSVEQHYGAGNAAAPKAAQQALSAFLRQVRADGIDWERVDAGRVHARAELARKGSVAAEIGFHPSDEERNRRGFELYRRYMTSEHRKCPDLDSFLSQSGLGATIAERADREVGRLEERRAKRAREKAAKRRREAAAGEAARPVVGPGLQEAVGRLQGEQPAPEAAAAPDERPLAGVITHAEAERTLFPRGTLPFLVTPGEPGLFAGYSAEGVPPDQRGAHMARHLDGVLEGASGRFARGVLAELADRTIVAPTLAEGNAVRRAAERQAGKEASRAQSGAEAARGMERARAALSGDVRAARGADGREV